MAQDDLLDKLITIALKYWHRRATAILLTPLLFIGALVFFANVDLKRLSPSEWWASALLPLIFIVVWYISNKVPKTATGKIGFVIALSAETPEEHDVIQADFVRSLQDALADTHEDGAPEFQFILLPARHAKQISGPDSATRYIRLCRANLLVFGDARIRKLDGKDVHALRINQLVVHRQGPQE